MEKKKRMYILDLTLIILAAAVLASSIVMEILGGMPLGPFSSFSVTAFHADISLAFICLCFAHIKEHMGRNAKFVPYVSKMVRQTKWVFFLMAATLVTGLAAIAAYCVHGHCPIGGIHGKIAFIALALALLHFVKRFGRFRNLGKQRTSRVSGSEKPA